MAIISCSVLFSPLTNWVVRGTLGMIQKRSSSSLLCRKMFFNLSAPVNPTCVIYTQNVPRKKTCYILHAVLIHLIAAFKECCWNVSVLL